MRVLLLMTLILISISCKEVKNSKNKNLIGFKSEMVGEPGAMFKDGHWIDYQFDTDKIEVNYFEDIIIAKTFTVGNDCVKYDLNIKYKSDTIELLHYSDQEAEELCNSDKIESLTYIINNPKKSKWKIIK